MTEPAMGPAAGPAPADNLKTEGQTMRVVTTEKIPIKIWAENLEAEALDQARNLANLPFAFRHVALMPDAHVGYGMPIGGVLATLDVVVPNAVGVDIGCGMICARVTAGAEREQMLNVYQLVKKAIPVGFARRADRSEWVGFFDAPDVPVVQAELESARYQLGSLGGGNHFIEFQTDQEGRFYVMIHSGSRNLGYRVANDFHGVARGLCDAWHSDIPTPDLSFLPLDSKEGRDYMAAMKFCVRFAEANRALMMDTIREIVEAETGRATLEEPMDVAHNYAAYENHFGRNVIVHRKGAIRARQGERGIIPGSMGTESFLTSGRGNPESFFSSSHGAGRRMGRSAAIRTLDLKAEQERLAGIVHGLESAESLDEAPGAYKDILEVMDAQSDLTLMNVVLRPFASIKG